MTKPKPPREQPPLASLAPPSRPAGRTPPTIPERIKHIAGLMAAGTWTAKMSFELAEQWGLSASTVRDSSAEASRLVRDALGDQDEIRAKLFGVLDDAIDVARLGGDAKGMVSAVAEFARISGVAAPAKVALTDTAGTDVLPPHLQALVGIRDRALYVRCLAEGRAPTAAELEADKAGAA